MGNFWEPSVFQMNPPLGADERFERLFSSSMLAKPSTNRGGKPEEHVKTLNNLKPAIEKGYIRVKNRMY